MHSKNIAIFLCDLTGVMAKPWVEAGYHAILVDPQHPAGVHTEGLVTRVGHTIDHPETWRVLREAISSGCVRFVAGFPPCTDVAVSGTPHFAAKAAKDKFFQAKAALIAEQCRVIGQLSGAPWLFENPVSVFSSIFGKPNHTFHPYHFTDLNIDDNYTKNTCLWSGGGFVMPARRIDDRVQASIEYCKEWLGRFMPKPKAMALMPMHKSELNWLPDDRIHKAPPGPERANFRSATPEGFARAVFSANHRPASIMQEAA
ncbi:hypothetical protein [Pseudomonas syringae]|uniref:hypothetical protein n=1 Tax=Pseudomonas syringae TaxID=317 RepID=UPI003F8AEA5C